MVSLHKSDLMKYIVSVSICFAIFFIYSCTKDKGSLPEEITLTKCDSLNVTYSGVIEPIINTQCAIASCHIANGGNNIPLTTYAEVKSKVDNGSFKKRVIEDANMPPYDPLPAGEMEKIACWLEAGAPDN